MQSDYYQRIRNPTGKSGIGSGFNCTYVSNVKLFVVFGVFALLPQLRNFVTCVLWPHSIPENHGKSFAKHRKETIDNFRVCVYVCAPTCLIDKPTE